MFIFVQTKINYFYGLSKPHVMAALANCFWENCMKGICKRQKSRKNCESQAGEAENQKHLQRKRLE